MVCVKCKNSLDTGLKCEKCGHQNDVKMPSNPTIYRSLRVTIFVWIVVALNVINLILTFGVFGSLIFESLMLLLVGFSLLEIVCCLFIYKLKKWALKLYIGIAVAGGILGLAERGASALIGMIFTALLLYFIFRNDWEYFE